MTVGNWPGRLLLALLLAAHTTQVPAAAQTGSAPEEFTAIAVNPLEDPGTPSVVEIRIAQWSTDAERARFAGLLQNDGPDALLAALRDARPVGRIKSPDSLPWDLHFAWQERTPDGERRILILNDRPIGVWERATDSPSLDYPFSVIELRLNSDGEGDGTLLVATKIIVDRWLGLMEVERYEDSAVRLIEVRSRQST